MSALLDRLSPRQWRALFLGILTIVVTISAIQHYSKASKPSRLGTQTKTAFLRWRDQIQDLREGRNIYEGNSYPNPPIMPLILGPLAELPPMVGVMAWFLLKVVMVVLSVVWVVRLTTPLGGPPIPDWAIGGAIILSLHPLLGDLSHGNVNIFIGVVVFAALEAYRRGWDLLAGLILALAVACKITPALFIPYFGWKWLQAGITRPTGDTASSMLRSGKILAGGAAGLLLWFFLVPAAFLGWNHNLELLSTWYDHMARPFLVEGKVTPERANQSIPGLVHRLLTEQPSDIDYDEDGRPYPKEFHNLTDIGPEAARWVIRGAQAIFMLTIVTLAWTPIVGPRAQRQGPRLAAEFGLVMLGMLLLSERTWKHHATTLILPYMVLFAVWSLGIVTGNARRIVMGIIAATVVLTLGPSLLPDGPQDLALIHGTYTVAFLLLAVGMGVVLANKNAAEMAPAASVTS